MRIITRRNALLLGLGAMRAGLPINKTLSFQLSSSSFVPDDTLRTLPESSDSSLAQRAAAKGLLYGSACRQHDLYSDSRYAAAIIRECGILVPEWELKWYRTAPPLRPSPTTFNFILADWMIDFAKKNKMLARGHTLLWHASLPPWFSETVTAKNAEKHLVNHIQTIVKRYAGKMHSWDVLNEAIEVGDRRSDGLRRTPWLNFLGSNYIDLAFRIAAEADPKAMLVYNDYGFEYDTPYHDARRSAVLKMLEKLKAEGTPIHAFGLQSHLETETSVATSKLRKFLSQIASLGLKILLTELDVREPKPSASVTERDRLVASAYEDFLSTVLDEQAVIAVITWGLSDRYSWLSESVPLDKRGVRGLPLDEQYNRKLAWNAISRALDHAPKR